MMGKNFTRYLKNYPFSTHLAALVGGASAASYYYAKRQPIFEYEDPIILKTRKEFGSDMQILTEKKLAPFTTSFRGKTGSALAAVEPESIADLQKLIQYCHENDIGFLLQGANTALKGQGTPNNDGKPVVIIRTAKLKEMKVLDIPDNNECKVLLVQPGLSHKEAEVLLTKMGYDLPHKIGSHLFGPTFGASSANACGGTRVDNMSGRASMTASGNMGTIAISADGKIIYNGILKSDKINSGEELIRKIDSGEIVFDDIEAPELEQIKRFMKSLFDHKSFPITNHRGENIFAGDGGEGSQAIAYQMYLIRKKPTAVKTFVVTFDDPKLKTQFYNEALLSVGNKNTDGLPIFCESMGSSLVYEIVRNGVCYIAAPGLVLAPKKLTDYFPKFLGYRKKAIAFAPGAYIAAESFAGRLLSRVFTPAPMRTTNFKELLTIQVADRDAMPNNIDAFEKRLETFLAKYPDAVRVIRIKPGSLDENIVLQIRNVAALATLTLSIRDKGKLFAFDDAIMPGDMKEYCEKLIKRLSAEFPGIVLMPYLYGHDLKQINHNDWVATFKDLEKNLSDENVRKIYNIQTEVMRECGGVPHAEHGVGDHADTDLNRDELVKLVAHRLINDVKGIANPGGGPERAFQKAIKDQSIVDGASQYARDCIKEQTSKKTLLGLAGLFSENDLLLRLDENIKALNQQHTVQTGYSQK